MGQMRNFREPTEPLKPYHIPLEKAVELETHPGVIAAINAVATEKRPAMTIWKFPTGPEADDIVMALEEYIHFGDFPATKNNIYAWGEDEVRL